MTPDDFARHQSEAARLALEATELQRQAKEIQAEIARNNKQREAIRKQFELAAKGQAGDDAMWGDVRS